ncbi:MaoC family dehydratase [Ralstonia solanacearum species complex bacterium KE056]|uniref:MaoC family dehydratase n=1 Tax=Ralstonia solanacearum species complex bacterium KE056 TaxID=3119585 RepID=UPI002FC36A15
MTEAALPYTFYFDDFQIGQTMEMGTYAVTEDEILTFARQYDPQPFHVDPEAARRSIYGGLISSGWMTCSLMMRLMVQNFLSKSSSMGSPGVDEIRWLRPVYPGDSLSVSSTCLEVRPSQSKPDRGVAINRWEARNQHGELVCTLVGMGMFGRRPAA